jgi:adenylate kinase
MRIVLMGPPGAGKGTQAKRVAETFNMVHLSSGDILRAERGSGSELGRRLKTYMDAGELVPDAIVVEIMAKAIASLPADKGLLLDGFPRTVAQAQALDAQLRQLNCPLQALLVIDVDDLLLVERITGRRSCPSCGQVFHTLCLRPKVADRCDACQSSLTQRADDTESVVRERLATYRRQTQPVIDYYKNSGQRVIEIDGSASPDEVTVLVRRALQAEASGR